MKNGYDIEGIPKVDDVTVKDPKKIAESEHQNQFSNGSFFSKFRNFRLPFRLVSNQSWKFPIALMMIWFMIVFILNYFVSDPNKFLNVAAIHGDLSVNHLFSQYIDLSNYHGIMLIVMLIFYVFLIVLDSTISLLLSGFVHLSFAHLFSNLILFLFIIGCVSIFDLGSVKNATIRWFKYHLEIVGVLWVIFEAIGWLFTLLLPSKENIFSAFVKNSTPILGASVGILTLLGWTFVVLYKRSRFSTNPKIMYGGLSGLVLFALPVLINQIDRLSTISQVFGNSSTADSMVLFLGVAHILGFSLGILYGIRCRVR